MIRWWRCLALSLCAAWASTAGAQTPPELRPPVVIGSTDVPYPEGARGDASVLLELEIDASGRVTSVRVIAGARAFSEPARAAASHWRFQPASRDGVPVAARIRARVVFRQPHETADETEPASAAREPQAGEPPAAEPPIEVHVQGERRESGQTTLSAAEVRELPGAFGDAFRAIEALPGVTPALSGVPYFFVRGAPPNNNGFYLDGIRIPSLFHVGLGPGVIHPGLIDRVDFHPGAAPARYGGVAGAIVAATTRDPAPEARGELSLRLVDSGGLIEAPFASARGSLLAAGRYGYPGPIIAAFSNVRLAYWDYQSRATWQLADDNTLGLRAFGSHDYLAHEDDSGRVIEDLVSDFHRVDLRDDHVWQSGRLRTGATLGYDAQGANPLTLTNRVAAFRFELEEQASRSLRVRTGVDAQLDVYGLKRASPADPDESLVPSSVDPPPKNVSGALYGDLVWELAPGVEMVPGLRVALFHSSRDASAEAAGVNETVPAIEPRFSTRVRLWEGAAWISTLGVSHQFPVLRVGELPAVVAGGAGFVPGRSRLQRTIAHSQGIEWSLPEDVVLGVTGFASHFTGLTDLTTSCLRIEPPSGPPGDGPPQQGPYFCPSNAAVSGHAHGIELSLRRSLSRRVAGWLSYTLSRSVRDARFLTLDGSERLATVPSEFDRTHVLGAVVAYSPGRRWRLGSRLVLYSGVPHSPLAGNVPQPPYHSLRDPAFFRIDFRVEKRWPLGRGGFVAFVLEMLNATLSQESNTLGMDCESDTDFEGSTTRCERGKTGPLALPSVGVEAAF